MTQTTTIERLACPEWCIQQDCGEDVNGLVQHESSHRVVRASGDGNPEPQYVEVLAELWQEGDGPVMQTIKLRVPSDTGDGHRYSAVVEMRPQQALRLAALLVEYVDLMKDNT